MTHVTIQLPAETARRLQEKAEQDGQTLATYLQQLAEQAAGTGNGVHAVAPEADEDDLTDRPWRGVFVPDRPRAVLFTQERSLRVEDLPRRESSLDMSWHRTILEDE
jgi:hypothetical protein